MVPNRYECGHLWPETGTRVVSSRYTYNRLRLIKRFVRRTWLYNFALVINALCIFSFFLRQVRSNFGNTPLVTGQKNSPHRTQTFTPIQWDNKNYPYNQRTRCMIFYIQLNKSSAHTQNWKIPINYQAHPAFFTVHVWTSTRTMKRKDVAHNCSRLGAQVLLFSSIS